MKKYLFVSILVLTLALASNVSATTYTGSLYSGDGTLVATGGWANGGATLTWNVNDTTYPGDWLYSYTFTINQINGNLKDISHVIIEVSSNFVAGDIIGSSSGRDVDAPKLYSGPSNPDIPSPLFGIKWDIGGSSASWWIRTDREPMWGDFYSKDGKEDGGIIDVVAYNKNFGVDPGNTPIAGGNAGGWALVPDTTNGQQQDVPEPGTLLLIGSGLIGLAWYGRKRFLKK